MEELIGKVENLKQVLETNEKIQAIREINKKIKDNQELLSLLAEYKKTKSETVKRKIINNKLFEEYKERETDINIIILEINQKLKEISQKGSCSL